MRNIVLFLVSCLVVIGLSLFLLNEKEGEIITIGATSGPYTDMVNNGMKPELENMGYTVEVVEYSDYIQPNNALINGHLDANVYQNKWFMDNFNESENENLVSLIEVPTAPMALYSNKYNSLDEIEQGSEIALPPDPANVSRSFKVLDDAGLITLKEDADLFRLTESDIIENKKDLKFIFQDAGQLPRSVDQIGLSMVPGSYAIVSGLDLNDSIQLEKMHNQITTLVVVDEENKDSQLAKDLIKSVESEHFKEVIEEDFDGFVLSEE